MHCFVDGDLVHPHSLPVCKTLLTLWASPVGAHRRRSNFESYRSQGLLLDFSRLPKSSWVPCISIAAAAAVLILAFHLFFVDPLDWAINLVPVGVTPVSNFADHSKPFRNLVHHFGSPMSQQSNPKAIPSCCPRRASAGPA